MCTLTMLHRLITNTLSFSLPEYILVASTLSLVRTLYDKLSTISAPLRPLTCRGRGPLADTRLVSSLVNWLSVE